jgi:hypothetical protein
MTNFSDLPGYLGFTSKGIIAIHADWPAYPEEHGWQIPLMWFSIFPPRTKFVAVDDIDRCVLFLADLKNNRPDQFNEKNFHVAVWHEDLLELQAKGLVRGVRAGTHRKHEIAYRKKLFARGKLYYESPAGNLVEYIPARIEEYDNHDQKWPIFRDEGITLTDRGKLAALELLSCITRRELKPLGKRVIAALDAGLFDTAVREACVTLETDLKRRLRVGSYGDLLVEAYAKHLTDSVALRPTFVKTFRVELRAVFKFLRNDFMHNLRRLDEPQSTAILLRVLKVRNTIKAVNQALKEDARKKASSISPS